MIKKIIAGILTLAMAVSLCSCVGAESAPSGSSESASSQTSETKENELEFYLIVVDNPSSDIYFSNADTENWVVMESCAYCDGGGDDSINGSHGGYSISKVKMVYPYETSEKWRMVAFLSDLHEDSTGNFSGNIEISFSPEFEIANKNAAVFVGWRTKNGEKKVFDVWTEEFVPCEQCGARYALEKDEAEQYYKANRDRLNNEIPNHIYSISPTR